MVLFGDGPPLVQCPPAPVYEPPHSLHLVLASAVERPRQGLVVPVRGGPRIPGQVSLAVRMHYWGALVLIAGTTGSDHRLSGRRRGGAFELFDQVRREWRLIGRNTEAGANTVGWQIPHIRPNDAQELR